MITKADVKQTLLAVDPATPTQDIQQLWQTVTTTLDQRREEFYHQMKTQFLKVHGVIPDSLTDEQIRNRASMDAENSVRGQYLEPLTAQLVDNELELEVQDAELNQDLAMQNPRAWEDDDLIDLLPDDLEAFHLAVEIWPTATTRWQMVAGARLSQAQYHGLPHPTVPGLLANQWAAEIDPIVMESQRRQSEALSGLN